MENKKKNSIEYEKKTASAKNQREKELHRRRVRNFKRMLVITFLVICAIPISLCISLMIRMNHLDDRLDTLVDKVEKSNNLTDGGADSTDASTEAFTSEQMADGKLEKGTESDGARVTLMDSVNSAVEEKTKEQDAQEEERKYNGKKVYLTFDDGPSTHTGEILDILAENNVKATFFVVYNERKDAQQYYKRIVEEGHSIGMHSYSHVYDQVYASQQSFEDDVKKIHDYIYEQTGVDSRIYRFPGGSSNSVSKVDIQSLMGYLYNEGITYYDWNSLSGDAVDGSLTPSELNANVLGYVHANSGDSIVLMHDLQNNHATIDALPDLIKTLKEEGYELCPIDDTTIPVQHVKYEEAVE